jgi:GPH family glycoside/pentoside/hexuronide:cation symporter
MAERLRKSLLYTFGVGDLCFTLMIATELYLYPRFLTDFAEFPLEIANRILLLTALFDIVCAFLGGIILQKVTLRFGGKYRSWLLLGPPLVAPLYVLQFVKFGDFQVAAVVIIVTFAMSHMLFNVVYAATGSMVGRLSQLPGERTILSTSRAQGMSAAAIIFSIAGTRMIDYFGKQTTPLAGFPITVTIFAVLMVLGYWYLYWRTKGRDPYDENVEQTANPGNKVPMLEIVREVFRNRPLLLLIFADIFNYTCAFFIAGFATYYFAYVMRNEAFFNQYFLLALSISLLAGTLVASWIGPKLGKRKAYWMAFMLAACVFASAIFLGKSEWSFTLIFCAGSAIQYVAVSMCTALYSDAALYGEWKNGRNILAFAMALLVLPLKVGLLIRNALITGGLMTIGFVANQDPTPQVIAGIKNLMTFVPAGACILAAVIFLVGYKIEDRDILRMQDEIAARRTS